MRDQSLTSRERSRFLNLVARGWTHGRVCRLLFPSDETTKPLKVMPTKKGQSKESATTTPKKSAPVKPALKKTPASSTPAALKTAAVKKQKETQETKDSAKPAKASVTTSGAAPVKRTVAKARPKENDPVIAPEFTPEVIAVRAYFLAERRRAQGLAPDPTHDWLQAENELMAEIERFKARERAKSSSKKKA